LKVIFGPTDIVPLFQLAKIIRIDELGNYHIPASYLELRESAGYSH
jgi:hypothetical protein